jgi:hypothetical protein
MRRHPTVTIIVLSTIKVLAFTPPLKGKLVDKAKWNVLFIQEEGYVSPVMTSRLDGKHDTPKAGFNHLHFGTFQHCSQTFPGIVDLEFGLGGEILSGCDRGILFLVRVNCHDQVSLRYFL